MSDVCRNCNGKIYRGSAGGGQTEDWFHDRAENGKHGMYRCDGKEYAQDNNWVHNWAVPEGIYGYWPSVVPGPFGKVTSNPTSAEGVRAKPVSPQRQLLLDAADTVDGERQDQYGNAEDSFATIAELWSSYINIGRPQSESIEITAKDVAILMVLFKAAREGNSPKRDNLLDLAGYAALAQRIEEKS